MSAFSSGVNVAIIAGSFVSAPNAFVRQTETRTRRDNAAPRIKRVEDVSTENFMIISFISNMTFVSL
jgi:hypothetical protein